MIKDKDFEKHMQALADIQKLYSISEAEGQLLFQLITVIARFGWSRKLSVKLLTAAAAMIDMIKPDDEK